MEEYYKYELFLERRPKGKFKRILRRRARRFLDRETKEAINESIRP